jgi:hypothetical protein
MQELNGQLARGAEVMVGVGAFAWVCDDAATD